MSEQWEAGAGSLLSVGCCLCTAVQGTDLPGSFQQLQATLTA